MDIDTNGLIGKLLREQRVSAIETPHLRIVGECGSESFSVARVEFTVAQVERILRDGVAELLGLKDGSGVVVNFDYASDYDTTTLKGVYCELTSKAH